MKSSKYNICLPFGDKNVIFNGVTKRFFLVSNQNKEAFLEIISNPDNYVKEYLPFLNQMKAEGFIKDDLVDELDLVKQQFDSWNNSNTYQLMILPTYACNVACWYCTQKHRNVQLNNEDIEKIKKHIVFYLTHNNINRLQLAWFGGEPLLNFKPIDEIAGFAQLFCKEHDIEFLNTITTNGTLLDREKLEKMKTYNFTYFQLTVDGTKEQHDKVKVIKGKSSFELTLKNVCLIAEILPDAEICLRYNFTMDNLKPNAFIKDLKRYLPEEVRKQIKLSVMKVWQQDEKSVNESLVNELIQSATANGFNVSYGGGFKTCYVDRQHFNCIFPNGQVDKCDNLDIGICRGRIENDGAISWTENPAFPIHTVFSHGNECKECSYLPVCYGPCPKERDSAYQNGLPLKCRYADKDKTWHQNIYQFCRKNMSNAE